LNELRQEVTTDRSNYQTRDKAESDGEKIDAVIEALSTRLGSLENFRGKALGFGALVSLLSAVGGALVVKAIGG
jgi:hypothetical protein